MMTKTFLMVLVFSLMAGCGGYNNYPQTPSPYGYGYGSVYGGYGYGYPGPYGYYPGPYYNGRNNSPYGYRGYGKLPISPEQQALNYLNDHRRQIQRLPPQQQQEVARMAGRLINRLPQPPHHPHTHHPPPPRHHS